VVELRLFGGCEGCPISMMTLKGGDRTASQEWYPGHYRRFRRFRAPRSARQFDQIR